MSNQPKGFRSAAGKLADGKPAFGLPRGAEDDTTGEYNLVQKGPEPFADENSFFEQPGGEGGNAPPDFGPGFQEVD